MSLSDNNLYDFGNFRIDLKERALWFENEPVALAPKVAETLCLLVENQGRLMMKDDLMNKIWADTFVEEKNLTQNISTLRKVFREKQKNVKFIETVPKRGYRFVAEVRPLILEKEEIFSVKHSRKMHIAAEGYVSKEELAETVKEIAQNMALQREFNEIQPKQTVTRETKSFTFPVSNLFLTIIVFLLLAVGAGVWSWQNNYLNFSKSSAAFDNSRPILDFKRLTESGNAFFPAISPDKQFVAYIVSEKEKLSIVLQNIETGSTTEIVPPQNYEMRSPQFSKDGNYLYYAARDGQQESTIYKMPIFGGTPQRIASNVNQNFSISPDGTRLAYFRFNPKTKGRDLIVCSKDGSDEKVIAKSGEKWVFRIWEVAPAWSPDGQKIVASVFNKLENELPKTYFVEINVADRNQKKLNAPNWEIAFQAYWLADGAGLVALVQEKPEMPLQLWHLAYPGGEAKPITNDDSNYTEFRLAPDSEFIIATKKRHPFNLQTFPIDNFENITELTNSTATKRGYMGVDWTPDGKNLVYVQIEGLMAGNIWKMNAATREMTQLTFDKGAWNEFPFVAPDGNSIVFSSNRNGAWHIWQMNKDGANLRQITNGAGEQHPRISPDGKWLFYVERKILWKQSLAGGEPVKIFDNITPADISPNGKYLVAGYYDVNETEKNQWKQILVPLESGGKPEILEFLSARLHSVRWNNEGTGLYFLSASETVSNIEFYSLSDKSIHRVTDFDSQQIHDFSIAPDGGTIAVGRGKKTNNIFKISGF